MSGLVLVPYNDGMRLGQGYDSFLQVPKVHNAVLLGSDEDNDGILDHMAASVGQGGEPLNKSIAQTVAYSSRIVNKISEVTKSMNISAGSSIRNGGVNLAGNSLEVDEVKFAASDINVVVSCKVINQQTEVLDRAEFNVPKGTYGSERFNDVFGDSYISGFIEGGDLHGIVSIKVLDVSKREQVRAAVKSFMNGATGPSEERPFTLNIGTGSSNIAALLKQTETTVTVSWAGGGQIRPDNDEWTLESIFKVAATFPVKVAACPQRTYAILTRYDTNLSFETFRRSNKIKIRNYAPAQRYTQDLLDMYMEYKAILARLQHVLANPADYQLATGRVVDPISIGVKQLLEERKAMKKAMSKIVQEIEQISKTPELVSAVEADSEIPSPEVWATRMPIPVEVNESDVRNPVVLTHEQLLAELHIPSIVDIGKSDKNEESKSSGTDNEKLLKEVQAQLAETRAATVAAPDPFAPPPPPILYNDVVKAFLNGPEKTMLDGEEIRRSWSAYRFDIPAGDPHEGDESKRFVDCRQLMETSVPTSWPTRIEVMMVDWRMPNQVIGSIRVSYSNVQLYHGTEKGTPAGTLTIDLIGGKKVIAVNMCTGPAVWGTHGVSWIEFGLSDGTSKAIGTQHGTPIRTAIHWGMTGMKGFFGRSGDIIDRIGVIWGS